MACGDLIIQWVEINSDPRLPQVTGHSLTQPSHPYVNYTNKDLYIESVWMNRYPIQLDETTLNSHMYNMDILFSWFNRYQFITIMRILIWITNTVSLDCIVSSTQAAVVAVSTNQHRCLCCLFLSKISLLLFSWINYRLMTIWCGWRSLIADHHIAASSSTLSLLSCLPSLQ